MSKILNEEFQQKVTDDLKLEEIPQENLKNTAKQHFYLQLLMNKKSQYYRLEAIRNKTYKDKYHYFKFEYQYELKAHEVDLYINADEEYRKIKKLIKDVELEMEYLEQIVKLFQNRAFLIKNAIDLQKMES